jgi:hypothetical protein
MRGHVRHVIYAHARLLPLWSSSQLPFLITWGLPKWHGYLVVPLQLAVQTIRYRTKHKLSFCDYAAV